ncbi:ATP-binding protein [Pontibacter sp. G13]|uniref:ATP-binding protein n=1 Tax=Pontibacter sp. G13 TaxID=3074898 RepID=UPI003906A634
MMMFTVYKQDPNRLFHLINEQHQQSPLIITTNKGPQKWTELLDDEVLAATLLDRLLIPFHVIQLN